MTLERYKQIQAEYNAIRNEGAAEKTEPPIPRLERNSISGYILHHGTGGQDNIWINRNLYNALSELAGHPLPIYEPSPLVKYVEAWEEITSLANYGTEDSAGFRKFVSGYNAAMESLGVKIWKFTITEVSE
jgi:hypothetical protein